MNFPFPYTPDYGMSDLWDHYIPLKYLFFENLKKGSFLLWTDQIGTGFPIFAQGQIGALNIVNLILFTLFSFKTALILFYPVNLLIGFIGAYLLSKEFNFSKIVSIFSSLTFIFSGFFIGHHTHFDIFQSGLIFPLIFYFFIKALSQSKLKFFIFWSLSYSQQMLLGNIQISIISGFGLFCYFIYFVCKSKPKNKKIIRISLISFFFLVLAVLMSCIQLLPTLELFKNSNRANGLTYELATSYPFDLKDLKYLFLPYKNPSTGNYHNLHPNKGIFWENLAYIGLPALILSFFSFLNKRRNYFKFFIISFGISMLMVLGKNSPFYFLFSFPPLNFFRIPSRFLLVSSFFLIMLSALTLEKIINKYGKMVGYFLFFLNLSFQIHFLASYIPTIDINKALEQPDLLSKNIISENAKIHTVQYTSPWNKEFYLGWNNPEKFKKLQNFIIPNAGFLWNVSMTKIHNTIQLNKYSLFETILPTSVGINNNNTELIISNKAYSLLRLIGATDILSSLPMMHNNNKSQEINISETKIYHLRVENTLPEFYFANTVIEAETLPLLVSKINTALIDDKAVIVSSSLYKKLLKYSETTDNQKSEIKEVNCTKNFLESYKRCIEVNTEKPGLLVFNSIYYPGWKATINNKRTIIYDVNLFQQAVAINQNQNQIVFSYIPLSFYAGFAISALGFFLAFILMIFFKEKKVF